MARLNKEEQELAFKVITLLDNLYGIVANIEYNQWVSAPLRKVAEILRDSSNDYVKFTDKFTPKEEGGEE